MPIAIQVHGGALSPPSLVDGCERAARTGFELLTAGASALDAAIAAVVSLENDGRYNAGKGAIVRLDGRTVEMDASVMDSTGRLGAVACITGVSNPVLVANRVADTPHVILSGAGATSFARRCGFPAFFEVSPEAKLRHDRVIDLIRHKVPMGIPADWDGFDIEKYWNFDADYKTILEAGDTVGCVAMDAGGQFAVASSTGGSSPMLRGRIGDTPLPGCGFFAGPAGAVGATGTGEEIIRRTLARKVYDLIAEGRHPSEACRAGLQLFPSDVPVGLIAVSGQGAVIRANVPMAGFGLAG